MKFEENCLNFHKSKRPVKTASSEQVRKPVNKEGMGKWKPYAKYLKPLVKTLDEDLLKSEDIVHITE